MATVYEDDLSVKVLDAATGMEKLVLQGSKNLTRCVTFSPDGLLLASGGYGGELKVWNVDTGQVYKDLSYAYRSSVLNLAFSYDGRLLAAAGDDRRVRELGPLASVWRAPLAAVLPIAAGRGVIIDCRSSTYAAAWVPQDDLAARWVQVRVPGATHMAKHTRGLVARHLCECGVAVRTATSLEQVVAKRFGTTLTKPARPSLPWILDTSIR